MIWKTLSAIAIGVRGLEVQVLLGGPHRDFACSSSGRAFDKQIGVLYFSSSSCLCRWGVKPSVLNVSTTASNGAHLKERLPWQQDADKWDRTKTHELNSRGNPRSQQRKDSPWRRYDMVVAGPSQMHRYGENFWCRNSWVDKRNCFVSSRESFVGANPTCGSILRMISSS